MDLKENKTVLDLNDVLPFGKYKGETIQSVIDKGDFNYLYWFEGNVTKFKFSKEAEHELYESKYNYYRDSTPNGAIHMGSYGNEYASENGYNVGCYRIYKENKHPRQPEYVGAQRNLDITNWMIQNNFIKIE